MSVGDLDPQPIFFFGYLLGISVSGVQLVQPISDQFHFRREAFSSQLKEKIGNILSKTVELRITLNIDGSPITSRSHTHPSHKPLVY